MKAAVEAILFAMGGSVEVEKIAAALEMKVESTEELLADMMEQYKKEDRGIQIVELEHAYQLCTKKEMYEYLIRVAKQPKKATLSDVALETLSIIAYKQPVTKAEIEKIRGVKSDHAINKLIEYDLVRELGRIDAPGNDRFGHGRNFTQFGVQSLDELPVISTVKWKTLSRGRRRSTAETGYIGILRQKDTGLCIRERIGDVLCQPHIHMMFLEKWFIRSFRKI